MSIIGHGGVSEYHGGSESPSSSDGGDMSTKAKIAFVVYVVTITLLSIFIAYCIISRKQRSVKPAPSDPPDEEQGRQEATRPARVVIAATESHLHHGDGDASM